VAHLEGHRTEHVGWLRAAVLGANDGLISMSSLVVGVAAAQTARDPVVIAAVAGTIAGALSMAAGEYVSVSSQSDTENAELDRERKELVTQPEFERRELAAIYEQRGLTSELAQEVADQLMAHDALGAHARDELGISEIMRARPLQAALASAAAFAAGALPVVLLTWLMPLEMISMAVTSATVVLLAVLGSLAAGLGGAPIWRGAARVTFWGVAAMAATALVGKLFGTAV
jgi:VIT1/CCC1 family predicted Fe2+/Mn2+ transporter